MIITLHKLTKEQWQASYTKNKVFNDSYFDEFWLKHIEFYYDVFHYKSKFSLFEVRDDSVPIAQLVCLGMNKELLRNVFASNRGFLTSQQVNGILDSIKTTSIESRTLSGNLYPYLIEDAQHRWWHPYRLPTGITLIDGFDSSMFSSLVDTVGYGLQSAVPPILQLPEFLTIPGALELSEDVNMPDNLVAESVVLNKHSGTIGKNLKATNLVITNQAVPLSFGENCRVKYLTIMHAQCSLDLSNVVVEEEVTIHNSLCLDIAQVTAHKLTIQQSGRDRAQLKHVKLSGDLTILGSRFTKIGPDVSCATLRLDRIPSLRELDSLRLKQDLHVEHCGALRQLPPGLVVPGSLILVEQGTQLPEAGLVYGDVILPPTTPSLFKISIPSTFCCLGDIINLEVHQTIESSA